jgi:hypothetical protein
MVLDDGAPYATRGWALRLPHPELRCRLLIGSDELPALERRAGRRLLAVTVTHIRTLASVQLKGPSTDPEPATDDDLDAVRRYCDHYFTAIHEIDAIPRSRMQRLVPPSFVACEFDVEELYNQTPGPRAGTPWSGAR